MPNELLIQNIRFLYKRSGGSRIAWSRKMKISDKTVGKWFEGLALPSVAHLERLSIYYRISINDLCRKDISSTISRYWHKRFDVINKKLLTQ